jgi:hypothetical protein
MAADTVVVVTRWANSLHSQEEEVMAADTVVVVTRWANSLHSQEEVMAADTAVVGMVDTVEEVTLRTHSRCMVAMVRSPRRAVGWVQWVERLWVLVLVWWAVHSLPMLLTIRLMIMEVVVRTFSLIRHL